MSARKEDHLMAMIELHVPAIVQNKAMIMPSSCLAHPKYQAKRFPTSGCRECLAIYASTPRRVR